VYSCLGPPLGVPDLRGAASLRSLKLFGRALLLPDGFEAAVECYGALKLVLDFSSFPRLSSLLARTFGVRGFEQRVEWGLASAALLLTASVGG
jgi:hypothetical protein